MHGLIAYTGPDANAGARITRALATHRPSVAASTNGRSVVAVHGAAATDAAVTRLSGDARGAVAHYGSVATRCTAPVARLLDGDPDDVVAVGFDGDGRLVAAAGRGSHRLFVHPTADGGTWVSSSLDALRRVVPNLELDRSYEDFLLGFGFVPDPYSMYRDVRVVKAGTRVDIDADETSNVVPVAYTANASTDRDSVVDALYDALVETIVEQAGTHRRHAVLLGGFDSALVAAVLVGLGHEVETYTFRFDDPTYVQRNVDALVAHLGISHHWVDFDSSVIASNLRGFAGTFTQPGSQPHYQIHTLHAARQIAADGHSHIFTGDGCDAIFLGYPTVSRRAAISAATKKMPPAATRLALRALSSGVAERRLGHVARMARGTLRNRLLDEIVGAHLPTQVFDAAALARLRTSAPPTQREGVLEIRTRLATGLAHLNRTQLAFNGNGLNGQSKVKVDGAVAATGVAQASPFMHARLRTFVSGIPFEFLRSSGSTASSAGKEVLVDMVRRRGLLPDLIIDQPKQSPSDSPVDGWYMGELRRDILDQLSDLPFSWDRKYVEGLVAPKAAEAWYRKRVSLSHHTMQVIGLLTSYASFNRGTDT